MRIKHVYYEVMLHALKKVVGGGAILLLATALPLFPSTPVNAACDPFPTTKGVVSGTVEVETAGQYTIWLRMSATQEDSNNLYLQVDDQCYVTAGNTVANEEFTWVGSSDTSALLTFNLAAGQHTIQVAGHEKGVGLDKVLLVADTTCVPVGVEGVCPVAQQVEVSPGVQTQPQVAVSKKGKNIFIVVLCILLILAILAFILWKFVTFNKNVQPSEVNEGLAVQPQSLTTRIVVFCKHHILILLLSACLILASVVTGVVIAASPQLSFEAESVTLSNGAKMVDNPNASNGKYVLFEGGALATTNNQTNSPAGGSNSGGSTSGGSTPGNNDPTPGGDDPDEDEPSDEFPNSGNTGPSNCTSFTRHSGTLDITTDGTVLNCIQLDGVLTINANNVTVQNSILNGDSWWGVRVGNNSSVTNFKLLHNKLQTVAGQGPDSGGYDYGVSQESSGYMEIAYNNISGYKDGVTTSNSWIHDNYIHDLSQFDGAHTQDVYVYTGSGQVKIEHNTLINDSPQSQATAAIYIAPDDGHQNDRIITKNFLAGGAYTIYGGDSSATNIVVTNNKFSTQRYAQSGYYGWVGYWWPDNSGNVWSGNTWADGSDVGKTITP